ncbi:MAG: ABC transporter permease [Acidobacteriia bacterium]|nr:ABC transporter permease [Terriglobia bacterium]
MTAKQLLAGAALPHEVSFRRRGFWMPLVAAAGSAALIGMALQGMIPAAGGFFGAGALALMAGLWLLRGILGASLTQLLAGSGAVVMARFALRNAAVRPGRTVLSAALIASATFLIVSLESFRRDAGAQQLDKHSGTGGYALMAESVRPLYHNPNSDEGRLALNLDMVQGVQFIPFRLRPGDDASCLNLYQPQNPRVLGAPPEFLQAGRFAFASSLAKTPEQEKNPWLLLDAKGSGAAIPAVADFNSMMYVLHKKLGEEIVLETGRGKVRLRLVAALRDSVLQGELIIAGREFQRVFPEQQGFRFFLMDAGRGTEGKRMAEIENALSDHGFDAVESGVRLAGFHRVENTYLSTFQMLGGLGLLLGTVGLAAILIRNVLERRRELALLAAVGFTRFRLAGLVMGESLLVLSAGLLAGVMAAGVAVTPVVLSRGMGASLVSMAGMLAAVALTGVCATVAATWIALRGTVMDALRAG